jgi:dTDP-4-amino-4,6-dideoxygalactose transaminase
MPNTSLWKYLKLVSCEVGPNYQIDDAPPALQGLFSSSDFHQQKDFCRNWFAKYFDLKNPSNLLFADNGRTCLTLILQNLGLPENSEILIQPLSCVVLPNSVWQADYKPVLVDTNAKNYNFDLADLEQKITPKTKVMIVQYSFGLAPDMTKIQQICEKYNIILIEDCAHALGQKTLINGKEYKLGTIGQAAIFSFGRDKIVSTTRGGMCFVNPKPVIGQKLDDSITQKISIDHQNLPQMNPKEVTKSLTYPLLTTLLIRPFYGINLGKIILLLARKHHLIGEIYTPQEKIGTTKMTTQSQFPNKLFPLLQNQLQKFQKFQTHRQKLVEIYNQELSQTDCPPSPLLRYPLDISKITEIKDTSQTTKIWLKLQRNLKQNGIMMGKWYTSLFAQEDMDYDQKMGWKSGNLPNAENLCNQNLFNLPTNIKTSASDAKRICNIINITKN